MKSGRDVCISGRSDSSRKARDFFGRQAHMRKDYRIADFTQLQAPAAAVISVAAARAGLTPAAERISEGNRPTPSTYPYS
jgi:hypothetical protein